MGPLELLILVALGVAVGTALRRFVRTRNDQGPDAPEATTGHLVADIGARTGAVLLIAAIFGLAAVGNTNTSECTDCGSFNTAFIVLAAVSVLMIGFGAIRLHQDRQATMAMQPSESPDTKRCPHCAELVQAAATVCRYCGRDIEIQ